MSKLMTPWGENFDPQHPLPEYPRPQLVRDSFLNLNGVWEYEVRAEGGDEPLRTGEIVVPYSPEAPLSGCDFQLQKDEVMQYSRTFKLPRGFRKDVVILHFGAVDQSCIVMVNGEEVCRHEGGYIPFSCDITERLFGHDEHTVCVYVKDSTDKGLGSYGKQKYNRGGMWYTAQSGIWQTVWLESAPQNHVESVRITPNFHGKSCRFQIRASNPKGAVVTIGDGEKIFEEGVANAAGMVELNFSREEFHPWTPEDPYLYHVEIQLGKDKVWTYFGFRKFSKNLHLGAKTMMLNNKLYFQSGLLDQGYWPDGLYTPPSDEAMIFDIQTAKDMGFNMLRKHIKIEPLRWYYHCDRLGMLVWQDMPSGGSSFNPLYMQILPFLGIQIRDTVSKKLGREDPKSRAQYEKDLEAMIDLLYNCVSLCTWVPFNEGWGQFDAEKIAVKVQKMDPTRLVDHASGWHDQKAGDFNSHHVYYKRVALNNDHQRVLALTEFGGYSLPVEDHMFSDRTYGYRNYRNQDDWQNAVEKLYRRQVQPNIEKKGLNVAIYTQLSDVEDEINGLITYDRKVVKADVKRMKEINEKLKFEGQE